MSHTQPLATVSSIDRHLILIMAMTTNLLVNIGIVGLNVALPDMERELHLSAPMLGWITLSLFIAMAVMAAPGAKLADIWGRKRTTIIACTVCLLSSTLGALAWDITSLLTSRVITGLGAAVIFTNNTTMVTSVYPQEQRGRVLGYSVAAVYVGLGLGPLLCGFLVEWFSWRSIFWLSTLFFIPPLIISCLVKIEQRPAQGEKLDIAGSVFWGLSIVFLASGLTNLSSMPEGIIMVGLGFIFTYCFVRRSLTQTVPILDIRLFATNRRFAFSTLAAFLCGSTSMGTALIMSLYLQYSHGFSPAKAGLVLMIQPLCQAVITPFTGRLSDHIDAGLMASSGLAILALGLGFMALHLSPQSHIISIILMLAVLGVGFATFGAPNASAIIGSVLPNQVGQASGTITAARLCGQIVSIALTTLVFHLVIGPGEITPDKYPVFQDAATICFTIFSPICLLGVLTTVTFLITRDRKKTVN